MIEMSRNILALVYINTFYVIIQKNYTNGLVAKEQTVSPVSNDYQFESNFDSFNYLLKHEKSKQQKGFNNDYVQQRTSKRILEQSSLAMNSVTLGTKIVAKYIFVNFQKALRLKYPEIFTLWCISTYLTSAPRKTKQQRQFSQSSLK